MIIVFHLPIFLDSFYVCIHGLTFTFKGYTIFNILNTLWCSHLFPYLWFPKPSLLPPLKKCSIEHLCAEIFVSISAGWDPRSEMVRSKVRCLFQILLSLARWPSVIYITTKKYICTRFLKCSSILEPSIFWNFTDLIGEKKKSHSFNLYWSNTG